MSDEPTLKALQARVRAFADERDWGRYHSPRNLAMALSVEAAELLELFLWCADEGPQPAEPSREPKVADEAADVLMCLLNLCDRAGIDLAAALDRKLIDAARKYPVDRVKGKSRKYHEYDEWEDDLREDGAGWSAAGRVIDTGDPEFAMTTSSRLRALQELRDFGGERLTDGLPDAVIARFLDLDPELGRAVDEALAAHEAWRASFGEQLAWPEDRLRAWLQEDLVNFYPADAVNPYVPLAARGPWLVTTHGAVLHDNGGYGMLGFGHAPDAVLAALGRPVVAANVMTPSLSHRRFTDALRREIGRTRGGCPFARFLCMNSGSEAVTVAMRIADARARRFTDPGGRHEGRKVRFLALEGGFHGRTDRPAQASDSSREAYRKLLRTFRDDDALWTVPANDVPALRAAFERADREGVFFEMLLVEPVMGEGRPGLAMTRAFYDEARRLSAEHGALLLVDSIQAGLRAHGVLSLVDYPGFHDAAPPDLETWSKALNAAQYPLSVLGLTSDAAAAYVSGLYGNTMTSHPRGLEVGLATLSLLTDDVRRNIVDRGHDLLERFRALQRELPDLIVGVDGTGLLLAVDVAPGKAHVTGPGGLEERLRRRGLGVIHGGRNALRFTPHFRITPPEVDLVVELVADELRAAVHTS